jgi:hypothetical protein
MLQSLILFLNRLFDLSTPSHLFKKIRKRRVKTRSSSNLLYHSRYWYFDGEVIGAVKHLWSKFALVQLLCSW